MLYSRLKLIRSASRELAQISAQKKSAVLQCARNLLLDSEKRILEANQEDIRLAAPTSPSAAPSSRITRAFLDRLTLNSSRIAQMAESLRQVANLPDPVGEIVEYRALSNGLKIQKIRSPLGVILTIFESRPNVAAEAFALAFKAGNAIILKGGRESNHTTEILYGIFQQACRKEGVNENCIWGVSDPDRSVTEFLLKQNKFIDVVVPRGGESLIEFVSENSKIPVIKNDRGLCHVYVHEDADLDMASRIVVNAKTQRPGVCNAMETLLVHQRVAAEFLTYLCCKLEPSVEWYACPRAREILGERPNVFEAGEQSWNTEYLDLKMNCRVVASLDEALAHIEKYGSHHSEAIVTRSETAARRFQLQVDAAAVYWNASTRFTDGFTLGLGGELGISTQKLHVRGPVGLKELTSQRWIFDGNGQVRT